MLKAIHCYPGDWTRNDESNESGCRQGGRQSGINGLRRCSHDKPFHLDLSFKSTDCHSCRLFNLSAISVLCLPRSLPSIDIMRLFSTICVTLTSIASFCAASPDVNTVTLTTSITQTETAMLTATAFYNASTEPTMIESVTVTLTDYSNTTTVSIPVTLVSSTYSAATPEESPRFYGFIASAYSPGTPVDSLNIEARGHRLWLGGTPAAYCPDVVRKWGDCPKGEMTVLWECGMVSITACTHRVGFDNLQGTLVPGGQQLVVLPDGQLAYTTAHSLYVPPGSQWCPLRYQGGGQYGELIPNAFDTNSLMACPAAQDAWQVFLGLDNATVPSGKVSDCIIFDALTVNATDIGAWQYT